jgi:hypothetical protein
MVYFVATGFLINYNFAYIIIPFMEKLGRRAREGEVIEDKFPVKDLICELRAVVYDGKTSYRRMALYNQTGGLTRVITQRLRNRFRHPNGNLWVNTLHP